MAGQTSSNRTIGDIQNEILKLESIKADVEGRLVKARVNLFKAQGGQLTFRPEPLPHQFNHFLNLLEERSSKDAPKQQQDITTTPITSGPGTQITTDTPSGNSTTSNAVISLPATKTVGKLVASSIRNQSGFLSLHISPAKYRELAQVQKLPLSSTTSAQGPSSDLHPRWSQGSSPVRNDPVSISPKLVSTTPNVPAVTSQSQASTKSNVPPDSYHAQHGWDSARIANGQVSPQSGRNSQMLPVTAASILSGNAQQPPFVYRSGWQPSHNSPQGTGRPSLPTSAVLDHPDYAMLMSQTQNNAGVNFQNTSFLQLAAKQGSFPNGQPQPPQQRNRPPQQEDEIHFPPLDYNIAFGKGLTKKAKKYNGNSAPAHSGQSIKSLTQSSIPQKRGPSVELIGQQPLQRPRIEPERVMTPPLKDVNSFRKIDENYDDADEVEEPESSHNSQSPARRSATSNRSTRFKKAAAKKDTQISSRNVSQHFQNSQDFQHGDSEQPEPEFDCEPLDPQIAVRIRRANRIKALKQPGYLKSKTHHPLSPSERVTLELRFCAQVTKIIGSKICVSMPPLPYDTEPIFQRLVSRFRARSDEPFTDEHYRSQQDFVSDAKRILALYVCLSYCPECPFKKSGNARVMCYRMRLSSILDHRMRELRDALLCCELETEVDNHEGRCKIIDEWFWEEDFEEDSHWTGS